MFQNMIHIETAKWSSLDGYMFCRACSAVD